ncbi:MAG: hypothetical protein ACP5HS_13675, partial [Anaerolineae bacterium]
MAARLASARSRWERLAGTVALASLFDTLDDVSTGIDQLDQALSQVRGRGYRFGRDWEAQLSTLRRRWPQQRTQALRLLESERRVLQTGARDVELLLQRAARDTGLVDTVESRVRDLELNVSRAESRVRETFDGTQQQATALRSEIQKAQFLMDVLDSASFDLLPNEHPVAACESTWVSDAQKPEGLLFLTDARLIFEQRQEVAKKKVLFITTEKELVQEMLWDTPIGAVDELEA